MARSARITEVAARTSATPVVAAPAEITPLVRPREIDPVQPKIGVLPRPEPHVIATVTDADISRFDRAADGAGPNAGVPRKMIVEIRPAILKSPTGPAQPLKPAAPVAPVAKVEAPKVDSSKAGNTESRSGKS